MHVLSLASCHSENANGEPGTPTRAGQQRVGSRRTTWTCVPPLARHCIWMAARCWFTRPVISPKRELPDASSSWLHFGPQRRRELDFFQRPWPPHFRAHSFPVFLLYLLSCAVCQTACAAPLCDSKSPRHRPEASSETTSLGLEIDCFSC
jgi:hypothetical protein